MPLYSYGRGLPSLLVLPTSIYIYVYSINYRYTVFSKNLRVYSGNGIRT